MLGGQRRRVEQACLGEQHRQPGREADAEIDHPAGPQPPGYAEQNDAARSVGQDARRRLRPRLARERRIVPARRRLRRIGREHDGVDEMLRYHHRLRMQAAGRNDPFHLRDDPAAVRLGGDRLFAELIASNPTVRFVEADDLVMNMRAVKSERELTALRKGSAFADEVGELVRGQIEPGVTEREIGSFIVGEMSKRGVANPFATCQSGVVRSGEPFIFPPVSSRVMEEGDLVHMEINGRIEGYKIDICRSTVVGRGSRDAVHLLETVLTMLEKSIAATKPGVMAEELEELAVGLAKPI